MVTKIRNGLEYITLPMIDEKSMMLLAFSDASYANIPPSKIYSGGGFVVFICDSDGNAGLINWQSKKLRRVVHSTLAAEGLNLVDCIGDVYYIRSLIEEILFQNSKKRQIPIHVFVDSSQLKSSIQSSHLVSEKLLRINIAEIKQMVNSPSENIDLHWISSREMLSDSLTKIGASSFKLCSAIEKGKLDLTQLFDCD